jgi:hypothetical protein
MSGNESRGERNAYVSKPSGIRGNPESEKIREIKSTNSMD